MLTAGFDIDVDFVSVVALTKTQPLVHRAIPTKYVCSNAYIFDFLKQQLVIVVVSVAE